MIVWHRHVSVGAPNLFALRFDEKIVIVDPDPQVIGEKTTGPVVVVAAEKMELNASGLAVSDCVEDVEMLARDDRGVFPVKIENIAKEEDGRTIGYLPGERDKPLSSLGFTRIRPVVEMGVCDKKDVWRRNLNNIGHRSV